MNHGTKTITSISIAALLIISASACSSPNNTPPLPSPTSTSSNVPRAEAGLAEFSDKQLALQDKKDFKDNNFLVGGPNAKFTVNAAGFVSEDKQKRQAAEGEKFHAYTFTSSLPQQGGNNNTATIPKISLEVDGKTVDIQGQMFSGGTIVVSAPENAKIIFNLEVAGVKQSMDLTNGKRTSEGIGDAWYENGNGKISDGNISYPVQLSGSTVTLKAEFIDPMITAYDPRPELGWADNGKKAWVIMSYSAPEWEVPGNPAPKNQKSSLALVDSKGEAYKPITLNDSSGDSKVAFLVPATEHSFTVHTENSADIDDFGKTIASTGNIVLDQPKITFSK